MKLEVTANRPSFGKDAIITIKGKDNYGSNIPIAKANLTINGEEDAIITIKGKDSNGSNVPIVKANLTINGETTEFNVNEDGTVNIGKLNDGNTEITISVNDGTHDLAEAKINVTVVPAGGLSIAVEAEDYLITTDGELTINITNEAQDIISGIAIIEIDGEIYKDVILENNKATIQLTGLAIGNHIAKVTFLTLNYQAVDNFTRFTIC